MHFGHVSWYTYYDQGFRVELDGVSAAMLSYPEVTSACAVLVGDSLFGFYTPPSVEVALVRDAVCRMLPRYSVPSKFIPLPSLPLTKYVFSINA